MQPNIEQPNIYQDVGLRKASNATCYNAGNPRNAVAPQPTFFLQHFSLATPVGWVKQSATQQSNFS
ncbi:hypothetical protein [Nostoc sp. 'Peltigera membranacea cyanobiont' 210A]|uniref:hypothetical protein n=1 Tax=Nostoc sp. 'Peltigera membranacea cyanobiont' 210A TaxID=2014529 RepID=UPI00117D3BCB|nr:hypothetical protein [Nostoc sp. 'Peltigera membranacea cyanobiont' 210A]